jgi:hypothetical protein
MNVFEYSYAVIFLHFPRFSKYVCIAGYVLKERDMYHIQLRHFIALYRRVFETEKGLSLYLYGLIGKIDGTN